MNRKTKRNMKERTKKHKGRGTEEVNEPDRQLSK